MKNWFVVLSTLIVVFSGAAYAQVLGATTNPVSGTYAYVSGSPLTFTVTATGGTGPYSYKWAKDGTSSYLPGETSSILAIDPVATGDAGTYYAEVTDSVPDVVTSDPIVVTITTAVPVYADEPTIKGFDVASGLTTLYPTTDYLITNAKKNTTFLYVIVTTAPVTLNFRWIPSNVVIKQINYAPYTVTLAIGTWLLGPLPKEVVNTSGVVTFEKSSTGDSTVVKPFVLSLY
jgi:hypothetical protein